MAFGYDSLSRSIGVDGDDSIQDAGGIVGNVFLTNTDEPPSIIREPSIGVPSTSAGESSFVAGRDIEEEQIAIASIVAEHETTVGDPPRSPAVLMNSRAHIRIGSGDLNGDSVTPPYDRSAATFIRTILRPVDVETVGDDLIDPDRA